MANVLNGTIPAVTGYFYSGQPSLDAELPAITGSFTVGPQFALTLPAVESAFTCAWPQPVYLHLERPAIEGHFSSPTLFAALNGTLPAISSDITGYSPYIASFSVIIPAVSGAFALPGMVSSGGLRGIIPIPTGRFVASWQGDIALDAVLGAVSGSFSILTSQLARRAVVMNLANHSVSTYENFNFNSLAHLGDLLVGFSEDGVYILGGDADLGQKISSIIESGKVDLSGKIPRESWAAYETDGDLDLTIRPDKQSDPYLYTFLTESATDEGRAKIGKGIKGRFFRWGLRNKSGSRVSLNLIKIFGDIVRKRIR